MINAILELIWSLFSKKLDTSNKKEDKTVVFKSKYFTLEDFTFSQTAERKGIDNTPTEKDIKNLEWLCQKILDPLQSKIKKKITVSSGFRNLELNKEVGSTSKSSQHLFGKAADIIVSGMTAQQVFDFIVKKTKLPFDQIIMEFGRWVHISYDRDKTTQRGKKTVATKINGKVKYLPYVS